MANFGAYAQRAWGREIRNPIQSMVHSHAANVFILTALPHVVVTTGNSPKADSGCLCTRFVLSHAKSHRNVCSETRNPMQSMVHSYAANVFFLAALLHVVVTTTLLYFRRQVRYYT